MEGSHFQSYKMSLQKHIEAEFGLDIGCEGLIWDGWTPGGDYQKYLSLRNVSLDTIQVQYVLPKTKYFFMPFPEKVIVRPGMSAKFPINFRPITLEKYVDFIQFYVYKDSLERKEFRVPVLATIPSLRVEVNSSVTFPHSPVNETSNEFVTIRNVGDIPAKFEWRLDSSPFQFHPSQGLIHPGQTEKIKISFFPKAADTFEALAKCVINGGEQILSMNITASSKYPYIRIVDETSKSDEACESGKLRILFDAIPLGTKVKKTLTIENLSDVMVTVTKNERTLPTMPVFIASPNKLVLQPFEKKPIQVEYSPQCPGQGSCESFFYATPGGNTVEVQAKGIPDHPKVTMSASYLEFGDVKLGERNSLSLELKNTSPMNAHFSFQTMGQRVFTFSQENGFVPPFLTTTITISFSPSNPINYFKRVFCVFHQQAPQPLDLLGTCFSESIRPEPLLYDHVLAYFKREREGLHKMDPESLLQYLEWLDREALMNPDEVSSSIWEEPEYHHDDMSNSRFGEFFRQNTKEGDPAITISKQRVDFKNASKAQGLPEYETVVIYNHTEGKISCCWDFPENSVFQVFPESCDIKRKSGVEFKIAFRPPRDGKYYADLLECYCFFKSNRTFRLVNHRTFTPPWCLRLLAIGDSFRFGAVQFLPKVQISCSSDLEFPMALEDRPTHTSIIIRNTSDTPCVWKIPPELTHFQFKPNAGFIKPESSQVIYGRFRSKDAHGVRDILRFTLNRELSPQFNVSLQGFSYTPQLKFEGDGRIFLAPTCGGLAVEKRISVVNPTGVPLSYTFTIPEKYENDITISNSGILQAFQAGYATIQFKPTNVQKYVIKCPCDITSVQDETYSAQSYIVLYGECCKPAVDIMEEIVDMKTFPVRKPMRTHITLRNNADANLLFELYVDGAGSEIIDISEQCRGVIPSNSEKTIPISLMSNQQISINAVIHCEARSANGGSVLSTMEVPLVGEVMLPRVQLLDVRIPNRTVKETLRQIPFASLNQELLSNLSPFELELMDGSSTRIVTLQETFQNVNKFDCFFGRSLVDTDATTVYISMSNPSPIALKWTCHCTLTMERPPEAFVMPPALPPNLLDQQKVLDEKLFSFPTSGSLQPGEKTQIELSYRHIIEGKHNLSLLFHIQEGKRLLLNLHGETCSRDILYDPEFPIDRPTFTLENMPLGLTSESAPIQKIELRNDALSPVELHLNVLNQDDDLPIFSLPKTNLSLPKNSLFSIPIVFRPLEDKLYHCEIIASMNGTHTSLFVQARGFHPIVNSDLVPHQEIGCLAYPNILSCELPNHPGRISTELLDLGCVATSSSNRHLVHLINSTSDYVDFSWDMDVAGVNFLPQSGSLPPNSSYPCQITMQMPSKPTFVDEVLLCQLSSASKQSVLNIRVRANAMLLSDLYTYHVRTNQEFNVDHISQRKANLQVDANVEGKEKVAQFLLDFARKELSSPLFTELLKTTPPAKKLEVQSFDEIMSDPSSLVLEERDEIWDANFREVCEEVVTGAIFNVCAELSDGSWSIENPPKDIIGRKATNES